MVVAVGNFLNRDRAATGNLQYQHEPDGGRVTNTWDAANRLTLAQVPFGIVNTLKQPLWLSKHWGPPHLLPLAHFFSTENSNERESVSMAVDPFESEVVKPGESGVDRHETIGELRTADDLSENAHDTIAFIDLMWEHVATLHKTNCEMLALDFLQRLWTKERADGTPLCQFKDITTDIYNSHTRYLENAERITGSDESMVREAIMEAILDSNIDIHGLSYLQSVPFCKALTAARERFPDAGATETCLLALKRLRDERAVRRAIPDSADGESARASATVGPEVPSEANAAGGGKG